MALTGTSLLSELSMVKKINFNHGELLKLIPLCYCQMGRKQSYNIDKKIFICFYGTSRSVGKQ